MDIASNTNRFQIQTHNNTNVLSVRPDRVNITPCHTFNEHTRTTVITIVVYLDNTYFILYRTKMTVSNSSTRQQERTHCSFRANAAPFHTSHEHKRRVVITIVAYLDNTPGWDYDLILKRTGEQHFQIQRHVHSDVRVRLPPSIRQEEQQPKGSQGKKV